MIWTEKIIRDATVIAAGIAFAVGLTVLVVKLKEVQVDSAARYNLEKSRQSTRLVQTAAPRGRILDRSGVVLAGNRRIFSIALYPEVFQHKTLEGTLGAITGAIASASAVIGVPAPADAADPGRVRRHLLRAQAMPYRVWRDVDEKAVARLAEHSDVLLGFGCVEEFERRYPLGSLAAHVIGYVGREDADGVAGDEKVNFREKELAGRAGMEMYCDAFLRGVSGERRLTVDARGFLVSEEELRPAIQGPDLVLNVDVEIQRAAERQLAGLKGACVVLDAKNGAVLALASAPAYDLNDFVPFLTNEKFASLTNSADRPLVNRAVGLYAPGSTFKPITALAALAAGADPKERRMCYGTFEYGGMTLACSRRWGHGELDLPDALRDSCNPYFAEMGMLAGTNLLRATALKFGLGLRTGIDLPSDSAGLVPDGQGDGSRQWWPGELAHMAIGQGRLLASPLQMAVVAGAIGTGIVVTPRLNMATPVRTRPLDVPYDHRAFVNIGMRMVVGKNGTGSAGAEGVNAFVIGKTGTAEVGSRSNRRKNTWFIAYAKATDESGARARSSKAEVAVAMVVENGESGGHTTAPKVAAVLREVFN